MASDPKIYTRKGDTGNTCYYVKGNELRVSKADPIFDILGDIDLLGVKVGNIIVQLNHRSLSAEDSMLRETLDFLRRIQCCLIQLSPAIMDSSLIVDTLEEVKEMEELIDAYHFWLPPLKTFITPGSNTVEIAAHDARCLTRKIERRYIRSVSQPDFDQYIIPYLNRLSDYFFALGRYSASFTLDRGENQGYVKCLSYVTPGSCNGSKGESSS